jgi:hypothetical protein
MKTPRVDERSSASASRVASCASVRLGPGDHRERLFAQRAVLHTLWRQADPVNSAIPIFQMAVTDGNG